jgi:hypothetical protein
MDGQSAQLRLHIPGHCANALLVLQVHQSMMSDDAVRSNRFRSQLAWHRTHSPPRSGACRIPQESFFPVVNPASYLADAFRIDRSRLEGDTP